MNSRTTTSVTLVWMALLTTILGASQTLAQSLTVQPIADEALIGKDLVLELSLPAAFGADPSAFTVTIAPSAISADVALFDGDPIVKSTGQPGAFTLSVLTHTTAPPGEHQVTVTASRADETLTWEGPVGLGFGDEWTAARITHFIENRGLFLFLGLVFLGGILMSATPCIYPMIPITLAVIGAQTQEKGVAKGFILALTYGLGLAAVYGIIGVVSATVFSGITAFLQSPVVLVPIAVLMASMSFAMFGAFELEAPAFLRNRLQAAGGGSGAGIVGAFVAGMVAGLVASPCVGPFLAALLVWVGTTGSIFLGFWSLFIFGLGLSGLLVAVGTFPSLMSSMPQSGGWMETVKKGMGLLLLFMAFFFVRPPLVLPESVFFPLLGAVTVVVAVFMGAFDRLTPESHWWDRTRKALGILFLLTGVWIGGKPFVERMIPAPVIVAAPVAATDGSGSHSSVVEAPRPAKVPWEIVHTGEDVGAFIDARIAEANAAGKPVIIDFWATWCAYCKKLDKKVWNQEPIVRESLRYVTIKVDATKTDDDDMAAVKKKFRVPGLPTVAFIDSQGRFQHGKSFNGYKEPEAILELMKSVH